MVEAAAIVRRWLTKQSLRQFLEVVGQTALARMWKHRGAFWGAVYDRGLISDAWVVFGPLGAAAARRTFDKEISFATFDSGSFERGTQSFCCVLVVASLRNGATTADDIIWNDAEARGAPKLYSSTYHASAHLVPKWRIPNLADPVFAITHSGADAYAWQSKVAGKLHQMTGVRISQSQYQVN